MSLVDILVCGQPTAIDDLAVDALTRLASLDLVTKGDNAEATRSALFVSAKRRCCDRSIWLKCMTKIFVINDGHWIQTSNEDGEGVGG